MVASAGSLNSTAPDMSAGSYPIVVINPDNTYSRESVLVAYQSGDYRPIVSQVSPVIQPKHLLGGDLLTITGTLFNDNDVKGMATVSVGDSACTDVMVVSPATITCIVPAVSAASSKVVVVTIPDTGYSAVTAVVATH
eukprot:gene9247-16397_t